MSSHIGNISAWEILPDRINPRFRAGPVVDPRKNRIIDVQAPETSIEARPIGDDKGDILKHLTKLIKGETTAKITEALPRYRS